MVFRSAVSFLLLAACATGFSQAPAQPANGPRVFHDQSLGITYFYPQRFTPVKLAPARLETGQNCAHSSLSGSFSTPIGTSAFVISNIGKVCPNVFQAAAKDLDAFTREQVTRDLKGYGVPKVERDGIHYTVDGRPASIAIASVKHPATNDPNSILPPKVTYAAKACMLAEIPNRHSKQSVAEQVRHIVCFDFTTAEKDLLPEMLAFTVQFDGSGPEPLVPGGILH